MKKPDIEFTLDLLNWALPIRIEVSPTFDYVEVQIGPVAVTCWRYIYYGN